MRFAPIQEPWSNFSEHVRHCIESIVVSHRSHRRLRGALHNETIYSPRRDEDGRINPDGEYVHCREPILVVTRSEIERIVAPKIRDIVEKALPNEAEPKKVFASPDKLPVLEAKDGRKKSIIRTMRLRVKGSTYFRLGSKEKCTVAPSGNHHVSIFESTGPNGEKKWFSEGVVSIFEARRRLLKGEPVISRTSSKGDFYSRLDQAIW